MVTIMPLNPLNFTGFYAKKEFPVLKPNDCVIAAISIENKNFLFHGAGDFDSIANTPPKNL